MSISASMVKELREKTSAGMMDCKKALEESKGDEEIHREWQIIMQSLDQSFDARLKEKMAEYRIGKIKRNRAMK